MQPVMRKAWHAPKFAELADVTGDTENGGNPTGDSVFVALES